MAGTCSSRCYNSRTSAAGCRCICRGANHGSSTPLLSSYSGSRRRSGRGRRSEAKASANFGITSYKGEVVLAPPELATYYETPRYKDFAHSLRREAAQRGVEIENITHVTGLWRGTVEPADSVDVAGGREAVRDLAGSLRDKYEQEAVMVITADRNASGSVYTLEGVQDIEYATMLLRDLGIEGGRFVSGRLQIADPDGRWAERISVLAGELGLVLVVTPADIEFV